MYDIGRLQLHHDQEYFLSFEEGYRTIYIVEGLSENLQYNSPIILKEDDEITITGESFLLGYIKEIGDEGVR